MESETDRDTSTLTGSTKAETTMESTTTTTTGIVTETTTTTAGIVTETTAKVTPTVSSTTTEATTTTTTSPTTTTISTRMTTTTTTTVQPTTKLQTTSTTSSPTTKKKESKSTTTPSIPQTPTVVPENEGILCSFMDSNLMCNEAIVCYGEGSIDCTEEEEDFVPSPKTTFIEKVSLSSLSEDYSDYDGTIATFPPNLVGVVSPKIRYPFLFKMGSLGTTVMSLDSSSETTEEDSTISFVTMRSTETVSSVQTTGKAKTATMAMDSEMTDFLQDETLNVPDKTEETTDTEISLMKISGTDAMEKHTPPTSEVSVKEPTMKSIQDPTTTVEYVTIRSLPITVFPEDRSTDTMKDSSEKTVNVRRKRDKKILSSSPEFSSSSMPPSFRLVALESHNRQKIRGKACKMSSNLRCSPAPLTALCKGKTFCQVVSGTAETSEKSTSAKGVENWAIAVIAICAIAAALTVSLLVYLLVTSWKKLKVQPQAGVTTLTYVNNTPP